MYSSRVGSLCTVNSTMETCGVDVTINEITYKIVAIYRTHHDGIEIFANMLVEMLNAITGNIIMGGDFNLDLLNIDCPIVNNFIAKMQSISYLPVILKPTRFPPGESDTRPTLLDHIWINSTQLLSSGVLTVDISDHCPTFAHIPLSVDRLTGKKKISFRHHSVIHDNIFIDRLSNLDFESILRGCEGDRVDRFVDVINEIYCNTYPLKIKFLSYKRLSKPWLSSGLLKSIKTKARYFKMYKLGLISSDCNKNYRNALTSIIRKAKIRYYLDSFEFNRSNLKKTWSLIGNLIGHSRGSSIKRLLVDNNETVDSLVIAEEFNRYFSTVASDLESQIPRTDRSPYDYLLDNNLSSIFLSRVSPAEMVGNIDKLKNSSTGLDSVPVKLLKLAKHIISLPLANLVNESFSSGTFPDSMKCARIVPIHKNGSPLEVNNYRPISVLPVISKLFERCMFDRLSSFVKEFNLLSDVQFGFRRNCSTQDALLNFTENVYDALDANEFFLSIFVDFSKAFDTVKHDILLGKMYKYGIRGRCLDWIKSYLENRQQYVVVGDAKSQSSYNNIGVPQGSILGPLFFIIYINDLPNLSDNCSFIMFADDTTLFLNNPCPYRLISIANDVLALFEEWALCNRLSLNISKTNAMIFTNRKIPDNIGNLLLNDQIVNFVSNCKFLGIHLDNTLKFNIHISHVCNKVSRSVGLLWKIKDYLPLECMLKLYNCFVLSYMSYCNLVWGGTNSCFIRTLLLLQKKCLRVIYDTDYLAHTDPLFVQSDILKIEDLHFYLLNVFIFKNKSVLPVNSHSYHTRHLSDLIPRNRRLQLTRRSPYYSGVTKFNLLPECLKSVGSIKIFKKNLKKHYLNDY